MRDKILDVQGMYATWDDQSILALFQNGLCFVKNFSIKCLVMRQKHRDIDLIEKLVKNKDYFEILIELKTNLRVSYKDRDN